MLYRQVHSAHFQSIPLLSQATERLKHGCWGTALIIEDAVGNCCYQQFQKHFGC